MSPAKVMLSPKELELVNDADWILTKNGIIAKVYDLFGELSGAYRAELAKHPSVTAQDIDFRSPKISKGEQYGGLPWVMLDHPRHFTSTDAFAIRSFFWWGRFCSITLQLSGSCQEKYADHLQQYFENASRDGWYIGTGDDPWKHHFEEDNYLPLADTGIISFSQLPFIKLAKKISLNDWEKLPEFFEESYREILQMLNGKLKVNS
ncbi:MAG: hypothetical protein ABI581_14765 [Sediminibacterium sp.]